MRPKIGDVYQHYKGHFYTVEGFAMDSEYAEPREMIIYKSIVTQKVWVQPLNRWYEVVDLNGTRLFTEFEC